MNNYQPRQGSLGARVIEHLRIHGGRIKPAEITLIFSAKNIANNLAGAIEHGALIRHGNAASTAYGLPPDEAAQVASVAEPDDAQDKPDQPLEIVMYGDGDVAVKGHAVSEHDADTAVFSSAQLAFLVRRLTQPFVQVAA
jgi:hypothetical protein